MKVVENHKKTSLNILYNLRDNHKFWSNPLLKACEEGNLTLDNYKYIFSQYYYYSKNFTKLLSIALFKCNDDLLRSKLSENLWEEGGGSDLEQRHAEIYRRFICNTLHIDIHQIKVESYTKLFFKELMDICLQGESYECAAALSFATEGIVSKLYSIFVQGFKSVGLKDEDLKFFHIHMECDDDHALVLEEIACDHSQDADWLNRCTTIINKALDLRNDFFTHLYHAVRKNKFESLIKDLTLKREAHSNKDKIIPLL